jgi:flagellar protein FlbD
LEERREIAGMVAVTGLNGAVFTINSDLIEHVESMPDTVITMTNGNKLMIREGLSELTAKVIAFRHAGLVGIEPRSEEER